MHDCLLQLRLGLSCLWLLVVAGLGLPCANAELVTLGIVPQPFPDPSSVSVIVDAGFLGSDEARSTLSGEITIDLLPTALNPATAQIVDLRGVVDDAIDFQVGGGFLQPTVTVTAGAGDVQVLMDQPGPAGVIQGDAFTQNANLLRFAGVVTTSVQPEPFDLAEQDATSVDFAAVTIAGDRTSLDLHADLMADVSIPVDLGILQLAVGIDVAGAVRASGAIPSATYTLPASSTDVTPFAAPDRWLRNGVDGTNSLPIAIDQVAFAGEDALVSSVIDLGDAVRATPAIMASGAVQLTNGTIETGVLQLEPAAHLVLDALATLTGPVGESVEVQGGGELVLDGRSLASVRAVEGIVGGAGRWKDLQVESQGKLQLSLGVTMQVEGELSLAPGAELHVSTAGLTPMEQQTLATTETLLADTTQVWVDGQVFPIGERILIDSVAGIFGQLDIDDTVILWSGGQAVAGDSDGNGTVDFADFLNLSAAFGQAGDWSRGDFDGNGLVDFADFLTLSSHFGTATVTTAVPEPRCGVFLLPVILGAFAVRRKQRVPR